MEKRILVVDDEAAVSKMMARALTKIGYEVQTAASAEEALELIKKYKYMVCFLDLNLPKMNGIELCLPPYPQGRPAHHLLCGHRICRYF